MTSRQIHLLRSSFASVVPLRQGVARDFYARLFELDPSLRPLFLTDMHEQGERFMAMLAMTVNGLDRMDHTSPALVDLGRRHEGYRVRPDSYATFGAALVATLQVWLGDAFTHETGEAWIVALHELAGIMLGPGAVPEGGASNCKRNVAGENIQMCC